MNSREKSKISTQFTDHSYHSFSESKYDSIPISEISKKKEVVNLADTIFHDALIIHKISQFLDCNELLLYLISLNKKSSQVVKNYIQKNFTYSDIQKLFEKADKELKTAESNIRTVSRGCFFLTQLNFDRLKIEFRNSSSPKELEKLIESEKITYSNAISMDHFRIGCCLGFQTSYLVAGLGSIFCG